MPILKENRDRYPKNWKEIRQKILERAKHRCEICGVENYAKHPETGANVILTIAHLGMPAHLPMDLHVARAAKGSEVVEIVGSFMFPNPEIEEWNYMMNHRTLSELECISTANCACFFVALPSHFSGHYPRGSISTKSFAMFPEWVQLTNWCLFREPFHSTDIAAEAATLFKPISGDLVSFFANFANSGTKTSFGNAYLFIVTGLRASDFVIRSLLSRQFEHFPTDTTIFMKNAFPRTGHVSLYHFDEYPENCDPKNLKALCQKCHNSYDIGHRIETRKNKKGQMMLNLIEKENKNG